jgi:hypothetical protein
MGITLLPTYYLTGYGSPVAKLIAHLEPEDQATLRRFEHVLQPPRDTPCLMDVLNGALFALERFASTLPDAEGKPPIVLDQVRRLVVAAARAEALWSHSAQPREPQWRRLKPHPAWWVFLFVRNRPAFEFESVVAGAALALALNTREHFPKGDATALRRSLESDHVSAPSASANDARRYKRILNKAAQLFGSKHAISKDKATYDAAEDSFSERARAQIVRKHVHECARRRQAVLGVTCQAHHEVLASGKYLRKRAEENDESAVQIVLGYGVGITADLLLDAPLLHAASGNWIVAIDVDSGVAYSDIEQIFPTAAKATRSCAGNLREASWTVVKPFPVFAAEFLKSAYRRHPDARTVRDLLPNAKASGSDLTIASDRQPVRLPTVKRFLDSAGPLAVYLGIDRMCAAQLFNDYSLVPSAKQFYGQVEREEIWLASARYFDPLDWGPPVLLVPGLPAGSQVCPTRNGVANWWRAMVADVNDALPQRRYSFGSLARYHAPFAVLTASMTCFCVLAREAEVLPFFADSFPVGGNYMTLWDKKTGPVLAPFPVPVNDRLYAQIKNWFAYCLELDRRLEKLGRKKTSPLRSYLARILKREHVSLFFYIDDSERPIPVGTGDLTKRWPEHLRFEGNFPRHFWQIELRAAGIRSSYVDKFARHNLYGVEPYASTDHSTFALFARDICAAQEALLDSLGIMPISGYRSSELGS